MKVIHIINCIWLIANCIGLKNILIEETKTKIFKLILVAPWKVNDEGDSFREKFYTYDIDKTISDRATKIIMFTANDEDPEGKESLKIFHNVLGGEIIELKSRGHYTQGDMGTEEFPELIEKILQ